jgi:hypothetical protein
MKRHPGLDRTELLSGNQPANPYDKDWVFLIKDIKVRDKYKKATPLDPVQMLEAPINESI